MTEFVNFLATINTTKCEACRWRFPLFTPDSAETEICLPRGVFIGKAKK
jgi:hypothetical protein